jgi:hypothetical protein
MGGQAIATSGTNHWTVTHEAIGGQSLFYFLAALEKLLAMVATHQSILCLLRNKEKNKASCSLHKVKIQLARPKIGTAIMIHEPII